MPFKLIFIFALFSFALSAQKPKPRDYNFEFVTPGQYTSIIIAYKTDSTTKKETPFVADSTFEFLPVLVKKGKDRLTISKFDVADQKVIYDQPIKFVGFTVDGSIVYQGETGERIVTNPALGYAVISFVYCDDKSKSPPKNCTQKNHYFGPADPKIYRP
jgi:hypothetical protein